VSAVAGLTSNQLEQLALATIDLVDGEVVCWDGKKKMGKEVVVGQIVYAPVSDTNPRHKVADVVRSNATAHDSAELRFRPVDDNTDFRQKPGRLPLAALQLGDTEELLVTKGKQRPCLVLAMSDGVPTSTLPEGAQRNKGQHAFHAVYCVAPLFSCSTGTKATAFGPVMAARIKCLMYPEFVYLTKKEPALDCDSVARLDRIFWTHLQCATRPQNVFASDSLMEIAWNQLRVMAREQPSDTYSELRELMIDVLPKECR
jgi:hypothetical protein